MRRNAFRTLIPYIYLSYYVVRFSFNYLTLIFTIYLFWVNTCDALFRSALAKTLPWPSLEKHGAQILIFHVTYVHFRFHAGYWIIFKLIHTSGKTIKLLLCIPTTAGR